MTTAIQTRKTIGYDRTPTGDTGSYFTFRLLDDFSSEVCEMIPRVFGSEPCDRCISIRRFESGTDESETVLKIVRKPDAIHRTLV